MAESAVSTDVVLFSEITTASGHRIGAAQLNAEKAINALNLEMIRLLDPQLRAWAADPGIVCVVLSGRGEKGFCAGGDVRYLRDASLSHQGGGPNPKAQAFFAEEYRLDYLIHTYPKPIMVWGCGIVMGGGLGLMAGASHRIVTESSRIAMPEISIGLYPDVGGSWFLRRMPGRTGLFLALTGASLNASDALEIGLADHCLKNEDRAPLLSALGEQPWTADSDANSVLLSALLRGFAQHASDALPVSNVRTHYETIQELTDADTLADVFARITGYAGVDTWLARGAKTLRAGSPTTMALIWELWKRVKHMSLAEVFQLELIVSMQCLAHQDFAEGVRALLIDKDNAPKWMPATLAEVSKAWVQQHFSAPWSAQAGRAHPLADL